MLTQPSWYTYVHPHPEICRVFISEEEEEGAITRYTQAWLLAPVGRSTFFFLLSGKTYPSHAYSFFIYGHTFVHLVHVHAYLHSYA